MNIKLWVTHPEIHVKNVPMTIGTIPGFMFSDIFKNDSPEQTIMRLWKISTFCARPWSQYVRSFHQSDFPSGQPPYITLLPQSIASRNQLSDSGECLTSQEIVDLYPPLPQAQKTTTSNWARPSTAPFPTLKISTCPTTTCADQDSGTMHWWSRSLPRKFSTRTSKIAWIRSNWDSKLVRNGTTLAKISLGVQ